MAVLESSSSVRAEARFVRAAPRKAQLVVDQIRGRSVPEARAILAFMTRDAAGDVRKVLDSAAANAEANHGLDADELVVTAAYVGAGPVLKRWRARARGRVGRVKKRTCHITVALALPSGEAIPEPIERPALVSTPPPAEPVAEEPAAEEAPAEEKPKRTRAVKPVPEAAAEAEEKAKPKRKSPPKAKAEGEGETKPKTERKPRAKKRTEEG